MTEADTYDFAAFERKWQQHRADGRVIQVEDDAEGEPD